MMFNQFISLEFVMSVLGLDNNTDASFESQVRHYMQIANIEANKSVF